MGREGVIERITRYNAERTQHKKQTMENSRCRPLLVLLLSIACSAVLGSEATCKGRIEGEQFSEDLLLRPLPDGKVLARFFFTTHTPPIASHGHHLTIFPKAIFQLVQKFRIKEMELSFTQGRWNYHRWGSRDAVSSSNAKPKGVELWAILGVPDEQVDRAWGDLTNALSGLFSSSINFLESTPTYAAPGPGFRPDLAPLRVTHGMGGCTTDNGTSSVESEKKLEKRRGAGNPMRYGALPREAACTENLTPWLKLLPCRDKAGLTTLLDRPSIYRGFYHSLQVHVRSGDFGTSGGLPVGTVLEQSLTLVLWPATVDEMRMTKLRHTLLPSWSLQSVFGSALTGSCPLASSSLVYLELEGSLLSALNLAQDSSAQELTTSEAGTVGISPDDQQNSAWERALLQSDAFLLSARPQGLLRGRTRCASNASVLLAYDISEVSKAEPLNVGLFWKAAVGWSADHAPFRATRFVTGSGNQKGTMVINLMANSVGSGKFGARKTLPLAGDNLHGTLETYSCDLEETVAVNIFQVFPWYIHLYWHTLKVAVDGQEVDIRKTAKWLRVQPAEFRKYPTVLEMELLLPKNTRTLSISAAFDKGFLRIDEHPPDANRGFDIPSALITFPDFQTSRDYSSGCEPLLQNLKAGQPTQIYTESLVVPLATPDFSMPYNVVTFTSTLLALFFGSVLNVLRRRLGEEERLQGASKDGKLKLVFTKYFGPFGPKIRRTTRLFKVAVIIAVAAAVQYVLSNG